MLARALSEFIVSAGSKIVNEGFVHNTQLGIWAVPEPSAWVLAILGLTGLGAASTIRSRGVMPPNTSE